MNEVEVEIESVKGHMVFLKRTALVGFIFLTIAIEYVMVRMTFFPTVADMISKGYWEIAAIPLVGIIFLSILWITAMSMAYRLCSRIIMRGEKHDKKRKKR